MENKRGRRGRYGFRRRGLVITGVSSERTHRFLAYRNIKDPSLVHNKTKSSFINLAKEQQNGFNTVIKARGQDEIS
ncbi:MAG: hypothetical protein ACFFFG_08065 [Candidatus Thorarchaeota archaeon]